MEKIGRGSFSTVYKKNNNTVLIKSLDPIKECMSLGWFPKSRYFANIKRMSVNDDYSFYEMKLFEKVRAPKQVLKPTEYKKYLQLRAVANSFFDSKNYYNCFKKSLQELVSDKKLIQAILDAHNACSNYSEKVRFEISPRNIAATKSGNLILLDCFFCRDML